MKLNFYHIKCNGNKRNWHTEKLCAISLGTLDCMLYQVLSLILEVDRVSVS